MKLLTKLKVYGMILMSFVAAAAYFPAVATIPFLAKGDFAMEWILRFMMFAGSYALGHTVRSMVIYPYFIKHYHLKEDAFEDEEESEQQ